MRLLCTIFIILISTALSFFVWMHFSDDYKHWFAEEESSRQGELLFTFDPLLVREVEINSAEGVKAKFIFKNGRWVSESPWDDRADNLAPLVSFAFETRIYQEIPTESATPASFGFGKDSHHVTIRDGAGTALADFHLGVPSAWKIQQEGKEKHQPTVYVRSNDDSSPTYLCSDPQLQIHSLFRKKLIGLRDYHPVFQGDVPRLTSIIVKRKGTAIELNREIPPAFSRDRNHPKTFWTIKKPLELRADQKHVRRILHTLKFLTAKDLKSLNEVTLPTTDENLIEVELAFYKAEKKVTLKIFPSTTKNNITLATVSDRPNVVFQLPAVPVKSNPITYASLPKNVNDVRARNILALDQRWIDTITIKERKQLPVRLTKLDRWYLVDKENKKHRANDHSLGEFIKALTDDNIEKFVSDAVTDLAPYGLDEPRVKIYLLDKLNHPQIISIGKAVEFDSPQGKRIGYYAKSESSDTVWLLKSQTLPAIHTKSWQWLPLNIMQTGITSVRKIRIQRRNKPAQFIDYNYAAEHLVVREGTAEKEAENPIITELIDANRANYLIKSITNLKAISRIDPKSEPARVSLLKPLITIDLTTQDPFTEEIEQQQFVIAASGRASSSRFFYLRNSQTGEIFQIDRPTCINLYSPIRYKK